jgi:hypothetical protein
LRLLTDNALEPEPRPVIAGTTFDPSPDPFFDGLQVLIRMSKADDEDFQQHVLKYVGRYINKFPGRDINADTVLTKISDHVTQENLGLFGEFLKALLGSPHGRWVPRPGLPLKANPISLLLERSAIVPRAIELAKIVIDYCIHMAKQESDHHFLAPVTSSLDKLTSLRRQRPDIVQETLQKLAYIPAREQSYIIDRAIIAHPPEPRLSYWEPIDRPIYKCDNPIMHLDRTSLSKEHNSENDNFTRDLFIASFDMLWHVSKQPDLRSTSAVWLIWISFTDDTKILASLKWFLLIPFSIWMQADGFTGATVKCHDFTLDSLDNPAIAALIEYKW